MPQLEVKTTKSEVMWKSPDGQRVIFKVSLSSDAGDVEAKTYSKDIAQEGWSGTVETYEKEGKFGSETFVKQPPKEQGAYGGSPSQGTSRGATTNSGGKFDTFTMYLSYAKDLVVAQVEAGAKIDYESSIQLALAGGHQLYDGRPDAAPKTEAVDEVHPVDKEVNMEDLNKLFPQD